MQAGRFLTRDAVLRPQLVVFLDHFSRGVQIGDKIVDLRREGKDPVDIIPVHLLAALVADLCYLAGKRFGVLCCDDREWYLPIIADPDAIHMQANTEVTEVTKAVGPQFGL